MKVKTETCKFIPISKLVPKKWMGWFYDVISQNAPFTWGDNNRTLITANRLANHAKECLDNDLDNDHDDLTTQKEADKWVAEVRKLGATLIDLEN